ncbi:hypothetical protein HaLaN_22937 [Haematococcus lacustris]|uniref:Uncharacterized protein n=1 Tax=Haematococcus lacustris TaxID=44745 RepID=A0A6A0A0X6_HAELA|nr:hypothetical protein HaLaN_22937 [Haematococcus lacustris]
MLHARKPDGSRLNVVVDADVQASTCGYCKSDADTSVSHARLHGNLLPTLHHPDACEPVPGQQEAATATAQVAALLGRCKGYGLAWHYWADQAWLD